MAVMLSPAAGPVLVTGAAGFIGSRIVARCVASGVETHALLRPESDPWRLSLETTAQLHRVDIRDRLAVVALIRSIAPRVVFHLATHRSPAVEEGHRDGYATNVVGLLNVLEGCDALLQRFIHFGSSTEYGPHEQAIGEDAPLSPTSVHGVTKAAAGLLCRQLAAARGLPAVVLRLFHVYGPRDTNTRFVPQLVTAALDNRPVSLTAPGFRHDWTYVEDVVDASAMAASAQLQAGEVINVASGEQWTNEEIVRRVERLSGRRIAIEARAHPPRSWDTTHWVADIRKARRLLNWSPAHSLDAGLAETIAWAQAERTLPHGA